MNKEDIIKSLEKAFLDGIKLGKELEAEKDKSNQLPASIYTVVKWKAQELYNQLNKA